MFRPRTLVRSLLALVILLAAAAPAGAKGTAGYQTSFTRWRAAAGDLAPWGRSGVKLDSEGTLSLDPLTAATGSDQYPENGYNGGNFYNAGTFHVGEATGPVVLSSFAFKEAIASWNAETPAGTWIETLISARIGTRWTKWYSLGVWDDDNSTVERHYVNLQGDADGFVAVDTLVLGKKTAANAFQLKVRLFSEDGLAIPVLHNASVAISTTPSKPGALTPGDPATWNNEPLSVPECSQMIYPGGGEVWCSPTSTSMVLGYWGVSGADCQTRVFAAVEGVYDWLYDGHGNWPFNTAYAATLGMEGYVARFTSMAQAEKWIAAGVPVVISFAWGKSDLDGAAIPSSNGHLAVLVGFDTNGDPIVNDPAAASDGDVQRTYNRAQLESLWLEHSGGTVYLIYPAGMNVPSF